MHTARALRSRLAGGSRVCLSLANNWLLVAGVSLAACSEPPTSAAVADAFGADGSIGASDVPRNPQCGSFDDGVYGAKRPWQGYSADGQTFTCNACRGGYPNLVGTWRFMDFDTESPATPLQNNYRETLQFDGNVWKNRLAEGEGAAQADGTLTGWYFCTDGAEMKSQDAVFHIDSAVPDGAFGNFAGSAFRASVKTNGSNLIALGISQGITGKWLGEYLYCRVGSTIAGQPCLDPFAP